MSGLVTLLGAGPGDAELLTLKGKRRLQEDRCRQKARPALHPTGRD